MPDPDAARSLSQWERLGQRIRNERQRQGLSRLELAAMAGVSPKSVQSAESGAVPKGRRPYTLDAIERALGWTTGSTDAVLGGGEPERAHNDVHRVVVLVEDLAEAVRSVVDPPAGADVAARARTARRLMAQLALELDEITDTTTRETSC